MSLNAKEWNSTNSYFFNVARKLVDLIYRYESERYFEVIVDIGVGSGNITEMLAKSVNHNKIYGLDVDSNMVQFAKQNKTVETIEYLMTDLSGDWNSLDEIIKSLEFKVSLIFSNMCIDLIREKSVFVKNLRKLMKERGREGKQERKRAFFSFPIFPDITRKLQTQEKAIYETYIKVPGVDRQVQIWTDLFEANGFELEHKEFEDAIWNLSSADVLALHQFFAIILDTHVQGIQFKDLTEDMQNKFLSLSIDGFCNWKQSSIDWNILDNLAKRSETNKVSFKWKIVYLVCKI